VSLLPDAPSAPASVDPPQAPAPGGVNRCLCFDVSFERLKTIADRTGGGLLEAHRQTGCGARCGLCLPYIQVMLKTGQTDLPVMWAEEFRRYGVNPGRIQQVQNALSGGRFPARRPAERR
jgi:bacterioferritin-associated ferredoxin